METAGNPTGTQPYSRVGHFRGLREESTAFIMNGAGNMTLWRTILFRLTTLLALVRWVVSIVLLPVKIDGVNDDTP